MHNKTAPITQDDWSLLFFCNTGNKIIQSVRDADTIILNPESCILRSKTALASLKMHMIIDVIDTETVKSFTA